MAAQLARCADFISFAVDEMTQSTFGWTLEEADEQEHFYGHISHTEYHALHKLDIEEISSLSEDGHKPRSSPQAASENIHIR